MSVSRRSWGSPSYPSGVRRGTAITLIVLFVLLVVATIAQLQQPSPSTPFPGPSGGTELPSVSPYRTPLRGLYLCGAGAHPGGGVTGAPGYNAARQALRDRVRGWSW